MNDFERKRFPEKKVVVGILLVAFVVVGIFLFKGWDTVLNNGIDEMITVTGHFSCLPLKPDSEKDPNDCLLGVRGRDDTYYGLDVRNVQDVNLDLKAEDTIAVTGQLKDPAISDGKEWKDYDIAGVMQVNTLLRTR